MAAYIYTVKDRETGTELFVGRDGPCAKFLDCSVDYVRAMARRESIPDQSQWAHVVVERHLEDTVRICVDCGAEMVNVSPKCKRCPKCAKKHNRELMRSYKESHLVRCRGDRTDQEPTQAEMQRPCIGCAYFGGENSVNNSCNYIFIVGKRRPCPPGKDCTVKKPRKK